MSGLQQRLETMGVKLSTDPRSIQEGVNITPANAELFDRIKKIKGGLQRNNFKEIENQADASTPPTFTPIKVTQNTNVPNKVKKVAVQTFTPQGSTREASAVEALFTDELTMDENINFHEGSEEVGDLNIPSFDPVQALQNRGYTIPQHAVRPTKKEPAAVKQDDLVTIVETISKKVSKEMLKEVLKEFSAVFGNLQNKKGQVFEYYNKEKNIIKIGEEYFQIQKVRFKTKS